VAYEFEHTTRGWPLKVTVVNPSCKPLSQFGLAVALGGRYAFIGSAYAGAYVQQLP
jgi:hypothetical protein